MDMKGNVAIRRNLIIDNTLGIGENSPSACLHIKAGTASANTAPIKFMTGTLLASSEAGALEFVGNNLYQTGNDTTRRTIQYVERNYDVKNGANYNLTMADDFIVMNGTDKSIFPITAVGCVGKSFTIKNINVSQLTVDTNSAETIDGETKQYLGQWESMTIISNGANWLII